MTRLMNLGNTCYINSALSIILSIPELCVWLEEIEPPNTVEGQLIKELNEILLLSKNPKIIISPGRFVQFNKFLFKHKNKKDFISNNQCDSTEYLLFILECIHECDKKVITNLCESKNIHTYISSDGLYREETVSSDWIRYICVPNKPTVSLEECLDYTYASEKIEKMNDKINKQQSYIKHNKITQNPIVLILQYNSFESLIHAPDILDISPYSDIPDKYELFGLINHVGDKSSGHYFTYIKHMNYWLVYDDAMKKKILNISPMHNYCMFYRKI
jgi:ubiquitin C-terminal hydrolase